MDASIRSCGEVAIVTDFGFGSGVTGGDGAGTMTMMVSNNGPGAGKPAP